MKVLLDTHVWLWWQMRPKRLRPATTFALSNADNQVFLSTVSTWEMVVKVSIGKLHLPAPVEEMVPDSLVTDNFQSLPVEHRHAFELLRLPMLHRDPFDRMLVAQARAEGLVLATADESLARYDVELLRA